MLIQFDVYDPLAKLFFIVNTCFAIDYHLFTLFSTIYQVIDYECHFMGYMYNDN